MNKKVGELHLPPQGPLLPTSQCATSGVAGLAEEDGELYFVCHDIIILIDYNILMHRPYI